MARTEEAVIINVVDEQGKILNYVEIEDFLITNPYNVNLSSVYLPNTEPMDLDIFFSTAKELIKSALEKEGSKEITVIEEYPPEELFNYGNEVITFKVISRKPGMMNTKATGRPHRKANFSHQDMRPQYPNQVITVESRPVDHIIEFTCWGQSNKDVNKRVIWLEKLFINSAFVFEVKGAERFFFEERLEDKFEKVSDQRLFGRQLRFFLRFREHDAKVDSIIRKIHVDIKKTN